MGNLNIKMNLFEDGRYHSPLCEWLLAETDEELYLVAGEANVDETDTAYGPIETAKELVQFLCESGAPFSKHPWRIAKSIQEAVQEGIIEGDKVWDGKQDVYIQTPPEQPYIDGVNDIEIIPKANLGDECAWRDCNRGTTDHDHLRPFTAGENKGKYLRETASRWQGSADYSLDIIDKDEAVSLAESWGDTI